MVKTIINKETCKGCEFCVSVCPVNIIKMSSSMNKKGYHYAKITETEKCTGCGLCFQMCPDLCIEIEK
jgi:2-oxoglutarate ferredoxin oxidoreductase subunit delta